MEIWIVYGSCRGKRRCKRDNCISNKRTKVQVVGRRGKQYKRGYKGKQEPSHTWPCIIGDRPLSKRYKMQEIQEAITDFKNTDTIRLDI